MSRFETRVHRFRYVIWPLTLVYVAFSACFSFPLRMPGGFLGWESIFIAAASWLVIALFFTALLPHKGVVKVFLITLPLTALGLGCRYLLEFGEVSNTMNFTPLNITLYLTLAPVCTAVAYLIFIPLLKNDP